jgi:hypothetical protein
MTALSESPKEDVLAECLYQHDRATALEAKLKSVTVRHLASMLNLRHTIEQLEDELERVRFRLTDPARVERAAKSLQENDEVVVAGDLRRHPDTARRIVKVILAAADDIREMAWKKQ